MTNNPRWVRRPTGANWGDFGPHDQDGRVNGLGPDAVRKGLAEITDNLTFCLSLPLDLPGGNVISASRLPPVLRPTFRRGQAYFNYDMAREDSRLTDVINDDLAILHLQYSTHWDALGHYGALFDADDDGVPEKVFYNGFRGDTDFVGPTDPADAGPGPGASTSRANALGVERLAVAGMQGRAVMIDLAHHHGRDRALIGYDALMRVMQADRVEVEPGDMICLHTALATMIMEMDGRPDGPRLHNACAVLDGRDERLLRWITDSGLVAIAADNYAVELNPGRDPCDCCAALPLHEHCLFKLGVPLGELWYFGALAPWLRSRGRSRFHLSAPPLRLPGAVGSPVTPIATV